MNTPPSKDLTQLVLQAQDNVQSRGALDPDHRAPGEKSKGLPIQVMLLTGIFATAIYLWGQYISGVWVSDATVAADLRALMRDAAAQVEVQRQQTGQWPTALPDPTLTPVIDYTVDLTTEPKPVYRLEGQLQGQRLTWTSDQAPL